MWDTTMSDRMTAVKGRDGWVGGQLLQPVDAPSARVIVGTWESRAPWEAWHDDETFTETRQRLDELEAERTESTWHEVLLDVRAA